MSQLSVKSSSTSISNYFIKLDTATTPATTIDESHVRSSSVTDYSANQNYPESSNFDVSFDNYNKSKSKSECSKFSEGSQINVIQSIELNNFVPVIRTDLGIDPSTDLYSNQAQPVRILPTTIIMRRVMKISKYYQKKYLQIKIIHCLFCY